MTHRRRPQMLGSAWMRKRASKKMLINFIGVLYILGVIFYYIFIHKVHTVPVTFMRSSRPLLSCLSDRSKASISSQITCDQCPLSLQESDGWFCEFNQDWQRRKHIHYNQDQRNHFSDERELFFLHNWDPTIHCGFEQRIGFGDGGKWVCDIHKFQSINSTPPLIYSFGSNGDFTFEEDIKRKLPNSEIHTFDQNFYECPIDVCVFHQVYLGEGGNDGSKSLNMVIDDLNHRGRDIDILKVDIEGSEFQLFDEFFKSIQMSKSAAQFLPAKVVHYIRQILMEIHLQPESYEEESRKAHALFETFRQNNYAIFHKEANMYTCKSVFEYAFLRLDPTFFVNPLPVSTQ